MKKFIDYLKKWGNVIILSIIVVLLLFALYSCIYTSITNLTVGILGTAGVCILIFMIVTNIIDEVKVIRKR